MAIWKIAFVGFKKYRKRRKNLTFIMVGSFFLLFFFLVLFHTIDTNLNKYWVKEFIGGNMIVTDHVKNYDLFNPIAVENYFSPDDFYATNKNLEPLVSPRIRIGVNLEKGDSSIGCLIIGIDAEKEQKLGSPISVEEGRMMAAGKSEIVLSENVAHSLNATLGDDIIIYLMTKEGYVNFERITIVGYLELSYPRSDYSGMIAFMPLSKVQEFMLLTDNKVSELLHVPRQPFMSTIRGNYRVVDGINSLSISRSTNYAYLFLKVIIFLFIMALSISAIYHNIILMSSERFTEVAVYLTYGAKPGWIRTIMILELLFYTLYCSVLGFIISALLIVGINSLGLYPINEAIEIMMASSHFVIQLNMYLALLSFIILCFFVLSGAVKPIWNATSSIRILDLFSKNKG